MGQRQNGSKCVRIRLLSGLERGVDHQWMTSEPTPGSGMTAQIANVFQRKDAEAQRIYQSRRNDRRWK